MPEKTNSSPLDFLRNKAVLIVTALLAVEIALFYGGSTKEYKPTPPPLDEFATTVGPWRSVRQIPVDDATQNLLKADDTLLRDYAGPANVELFVAFFKSQRAGVSPHSPKACLPGSGWTPESSRTISIHVPGEPAPISVNRYVVSHNEFRNLVVYWYQSPHRVTADEYMSKFYLIVDSLRYRRSDEALVRVITSIGGTTDEAAAEGQALQFIDAIYQPLKQQMWTGMDRASLSPELVPRRHEAESSVPNRRME